MGRVYAMQVRIHNTLVSLRSMEMVNSKNHIEAVGR